jgi:PKD repeat protein
MTAGAGALAITVNGVNSCGNGAPYSLATVNVTPTPSAAFTVGSPSVVTSANESVVFTGSAPGATSYSWSFDGGTASPGTGAGPQTVTWSTAGTKVITLTLDNGGCLSTVSDTVTVNDKSTGIANLPVAIGEMSIVPNPTYGQANILLQVNTEATISADLYDMSGRLISNIFAGTVSTGKKTITFGTDNISSGVYVVRITDGNASLQTRFIKLN